MFNQDVKQAAKRRGVLLWQIAERYGMSDANFSRKLRKELPSEEKEKIYGFIQEIVAEREAVN